MLTCEVSTNYHAGGRRRALHHCLFFPDFDAAARLARRVARFGRLDGDGRPTLALDSRSLLECVLECSPRAHLIPAHIWTPWYALFGSKSGFDSLEECYGDLTAHIFALETGLSSDPAMNRRVAALNDYALVSNSDAHSPPMIGREATIFDTPLDYDAIFSALQQADSPGLVGTVEFYPHEGKYYWDGHRACGVAVDPTTRRSYNGRCPICGRPLTIGVLSRVEQLAEERPPAPEAVPEPATTSVYRPDDSPWMRPALYAVRLVEILAEALGVVGTNTKRVRDLWQRLLESCGPEYHILLEAPTEEVATVAGDRVARAIANMRGGRVHTKPGFDGQFGRVNCLSD